MRGNNASDSVLAAWRAAFSTESDCPWPGPRPLGLPGASPTSNATPSHAVAHLHGRENDIHDLVSAIAVNDLVIFHGQSGVGKTSLLYAGLIPELEARGKTVVACRQWGGESFDLEPSVQLVAQAQSHVPARVLVDGAEPRALDIDAPGLVVILDQFEELIRKNPVYARRVMSWVESTAGESAATFVISLRSEFAHQLRDLRLRAFTARQTVVLDPIASESTIREIVGGARHKMPIDQEEAVEAVVAIWRESQDEAATAGWELPGLLHLQSTLQVLWRYRAELGETQVTLAAVNLFVKRAREAAGKPNAIQGQSGGLWYGLVASVEVAIASCISACERTAIGASESADATVISAPMRNQTEWMLRDITKHLASGGYKTPRDLWELAGIVLNLSAPSNDESRETLDTLYGHEDWLGVSRATLNVAESKTLALSEHSSGPAAGLSKSALFIELARCFLFALEWLHATSIVEIEHSKSGHVVALRHDRYAEGLEAWRATVEPGFDEAVGRYSAHLGAHLDWSDDRSATHTSDERVVVANVGWLSCNIENTTFHNIDFVNCNFAGTTFRNCTFNGVTFVNCVLDNADIVACTIVGAPQWTDSKKLDRMTFLVLENPPSYHFPVSPDTARDLGALNGRTTVLAESGEAHLYSQTSGMAAVARPGSKASADNLASVERRASIAALKGARGAREKDRDPTLGPELPLTPGGLAMCGGRVSSLTLRRLRFADKGATVSLRHVAGTSLEICEQIGGNFDVFAAAIRGLTVTGPIDTARAEIRERQRANPPFSFSVHQATLVNTWFGVGIVGSATIDNSKFWQAINAAPDTFEVEISRSSYTGLVATGRPKDDLRESGPNRALRLDGLGDPNPLDGPPTADAEATLKDLRDLSANIDYREDEETAEEGESA